MKGRVWIGSILNERMVFVIDLESMCIIIFFLGQFDLTCGFCDFHKRALPLSYFYLIKAQRSKNFFFYWRKPHPLRKCILWD